MLCSTNSSLEASQTNSLKRLENIQTKDNSQLNLFEEFTSNDAVEPQFENYKTLFDTKYNYKLIEKEEDMRKNL